MSYLSLRKEKHMRVKALTVGMMALVLIMLPCVAQIASASPGHNREPSTVPITTNISLGYDWSWWDGLTFSLDLDRNDQNNIATYGSAAVLLTATEACAALAWVVVPCKVAVGLAAVWIASEVSGWNGVCDELIVYYNVNGVYKDSDCIQYWDGWYTA